MTHRPIIEDKYQLYENDLVVANNVIFAFEDEIVSILWCMIHTDNHCVL